MCGWARAKIHEKVVWKKPGYRQTDGPTDHRTQPLIELLAHDRKKSRLKRKSACSFLPSFIHTVTKGRRNNSSQVLSLFLLCNWILVGQNFCDFEMETSDWLRSRLINQWEKRCKNFRHCGSTSLFSTIIENLCVCVCAWLTITK